MEERGEPGGVVGDRNTISFAQKMSGTLRIGNVETSYDHSCGRAMLARFLTAEFNAYFQARFVGAQRQFGFVQGCNGFYRCKT